MLFFDGAAGLFLFGLWLFCIFDVITTPEGGCRNLPKLVWLLIVIVLPDIGSITWLVLGHDWQGTRVGGPQRGQPGRASSGRFPQHDRRGRYVPANPDDDEEFMASLRARAEEQRRRAREAQRAAEDDPPKAQD